MANPYITEFAFKASAAAIQRDGGDPEKLMSTAETVVAFREQGVLTDAQVSALSDMLDMEIEVPDAPDTWDARVESIETQASDNADAIADLSTVASETAEACSDCADAIADLSEVVSEIVGGGE